MKLRHEHFTIDFSGFEWKVLEVKNIDMHREGLMVNDIVRNVDGADVNTNRAECKQKIDSKHWELKLTMEVIQIYILSITHF